MKLPDSGFLNFDPNSIKPEVELENTVSPFVEMVQEQNNLLREQNDELKRNNDKNEKELKNSKILNWIMAIIAFLSLGATIVFGILSLL